MDEKMKKNFFKCFENAPNNSVNLVNHSYRVAIMELPAPGRNFSKIHENKSCVVYYSFIYNLSKICFKNDPL